jgi:hypothetical protein
MTLGVLGKNIRARGNLAMREGKQVIGRSVATCEALALKVPGRMRNAANSLDRVQNLFLYVLVDAGVKRT